MRRWRSLVCTGVLAVVALATPFPTFAQSGPEPARWELSGAYTYLREPRTDLALPRGWLAGVAARIGPIWATVEVDRSATTLPLLVGDDATMSMSSVMAGGRVAGRIGPFREFAQLLVGRARAKGVLFGVESAESRFSVQPGIGLEYPMGPLAARLRLDARGVSSEDGSWIYQLRAAAGLAYSFR